MTDTLVLCGSHSSPYSRKMRAVLRYRRIPHDWVIRGSRWDDLPDPPVPIIPILAWRDDNGEYRDLMVDSSPEISMLEEAFAGRSVVPADPATAFLDFLLEDFGDEWVSKMMYHWRWANDVDAQKSGRILPLDRSLQLPDEYAAKAHEMFVTRQVLRRGLIGSSDNNAPVIEASYERTLDLLQAHLAHQDFFFGDRPGRSDFAVFGQLLPMLWWDPTPTAVGVDRAPRALIWVQWMDDLSWWRVEDDAAGWDAADAIANTTRALFVEAGRTYVPFMVANAEALANGADEVVCEIDDVTFRQGAFGYQGKCVQWIRDAYNALATVDRDRVDAVLEGTGCEVLVHTRTI